MLARLDSPDPRRRLRALSFALKSERTGDHYVQPLLGMIGTSGRDELGNFVAALRSRKDESAGALRRFIAEVQDVDEKSNAYRADTTTMLPFYKQWDSNVIRELPA